jgi:hypothetical protein
MCSYMAMFPPTIPRVFIDWLSSPGDVVYDPFSGRGTTILEARSSGRQGLGSDANPLAWILSSAKASPPSRGAVISRLALLRDSLQRRDPSSESPEIQAVFHPDVLAQLLWLRETLSVRSAVDRYLYAVMLGILHANARKDGTTRGLSISMPNTFAMAPGYIMKYKRANNLKAPPVDVLQQLVGRIESLGWNKARETAGHAWLQDATKPIAIPERYQRPKLIFTSPPYLGVMKYAKLNWVRHWLLGAPPAVVDARLFASASLDRYLDFMSSVTSELAAVLADGGRLCYVIGDVKERDGDRITNLARAVADYCVSRAGLRVDAIIKDALPVRRKVSRIWRERRGHATKVDRILILSRPETSRLPPVPMIDWIRPPEWTRRRARG